MRLSREDLEQLYLEPNVIYSSDKHRMLIICKIRLRPVTISENTTPRSRGEMDKKEKIFIARG